MLRQAGATLDPETRLYYSNARWYEPTTGRFITEDPARDGQAWYAYCYNNPLRYVDPTGLEVLRTFGLDRMTNYGPDTMLGNTRTGQMFNRLGCYVTALANTLGSLRAYAYRGAVSKPVDFRATMELNSRSDLFEPHSGNMPLQSMDRVFGEGKWDYWTKAVQGQEKLQELLNGYADSNKKYLVVGVSDLSSATQGVTNHMVGINALPGEGGVFEPSSITPSSAGDVGRLANADQRQAYRMENLKEFRVVEVEQ